MGCIHATDGKIFHRWACYCVWTAEWTKDKKADYMLFIKSNIPLAIVEAKDANHSVGAGMQQAVERMVSLNFTAETSLMND